MYTVFVTNNVMHQKNQIGCQLATLCSINAEIEFVLPKVKQVT